ncbi:winged helix-turn-helix domain-containing protein [Shewanella electrodiphila]|uniref:Winged helix-turn-helix domain-containing protein n=1 Tax=Shewanella electrodiphila TaxID=934143 RepID=A0ABT0KUC0_9GAMM|nr:winged helix-turn-helix domain-containing protein [Shewanella electrodiphila]MCL1046955.1 winged helix-turn-helix domain-containing protein [Shewanella electrodiphila]
MISLPYQRYQIGQCTINCYDMTITSNDNTVALPAKVFEFLKLLILYPEQTVTKEQAIEQVWQGNIEVGKRGTGNAIWQLRKSFSELGQQPEHYFKTVTKVGYQLLIQPTPIIKTNSNVIRETVEHKKNVFIAVTVLMLAAIGLFAVQSADKLTKSNTVNTSITPQRITNFEGVEERAAISPDGRFMAFQWRKANAKGHLYIKDLDDDKAPLRQISMSKDTEGVPTWSPDGHSLAYMRHTADNQCFIHVRDLITNQDKQLDSGCISKGYLHSLEWSPNGKYLAYSKAKEDRSVIHQYRFSDNTVTALTSPIAGEHDLMVTWSADSSQLAIMRSQENMIAKVMLHTLSTNTTEVIADNETLVIGLDWDHNSNLLYFTALREAAFIIQRYDFDTQTLSSFHQDETISSITISEATNDLYYSRHISQEFITQRSLTDGSIVKQLISSSRDLYGQYFAKTDGLIFLSNRSGDWELWLKEDNKNTMLTDGMGMVSIPATSPQNSMYVAPIRTKGLDYNELYLGDTANQSLVKIPQVKGNVRYASFSVDGSRVYYSSLIDEQWGFYQYDLASKQVKLILNDNIKYAVEDNNQGMYYTLDNVAGIYYLAAGSTQPIKVNNTLRAKDWGSFFFQNNALYYLERSDENDLIKRLTSNGESEIAFKLPAMSIRNERSIAAASDDTIIVSMQGINDADIYRIPLH